MTVRYVDGTNGNDAWDGLSPNFVSGTTGPKATLSGAEDTVTAGDLVHVRSGTYREQLACVSSGTAGSAIEYRGDYGGVIWANGGVVRVTGSDNDQTITRNDCIFASAKSYRTFTGFAFDSCNNGLIQCGGTGSTNWIIQRCSFGSTIGAGISLQGASQANHLVDSCVFLMGAGSSSNIAATHTSTVDNTSHIVQNCIFIGSRRGLTSTRVGGMTIKNSLIYGCDRGVYIDTALSAGQTITVNNCIITGATTAAFNGTSTSEIIEDYNALSGNFANYTNTNAGAHTLSYPILFDPRWFFEATK